MAVIRSLFQAEGSIDELKAIRLIAQAFGNPRLTEKVRHEIRSQIRTAIRRGIVERHNGVICLMCKSIEDYDRDFLRSQFLASLSRRWTSREQAVLAFSRWMGFGRTGKKITAAAASLINRLLRTNRIEKNSSGEIRRV